MFTKTKITFICLTLALSLSAFGGDAKEALLARIRKQTTSGPYRVKSTTTSDKSTTESNGEIIPPDQMHMQQNIDGIAIEMIGIGDKGWTKMDGKWETSPFFTGKMMSQFLQNVNVDELASNISNVQDVGEESLNGKPAKVYTYHMELGEDKGGVRSDTKVWIDSASGRPVKIESNGEAMGVKSKTVQTIEYDSTIKIEPPVK